jgi:hypothetical protein
MGSTAWMFYYRPLLSSVKSIELFMSLSRIS